MQKENIKYYVYKYNKRMEDKQILSSIIERDYIKTYQKNKTIIQDIPYNQFIWKNIFKKYHIYKTNLFIKKIQSDIIKSNITYDIEINYIYHKKKSSKRKIGYSNYYYECNIKCYNEKRKIGFSKKIKIKNLNIKRLKKEIFQYNDILQKKVDLEEGTVDSKQIIIEKYAFSQILSIYKKNLWNIRDRINCNSKIKVCTKKKNIFNIESYQKKYKKEKNILDLNTELSDIISNKNFQFFNINKTNNIYDKLQSGYVITNVYFLNNNKENNNLIKVLCSGYYMNNHKIKYLYSNKLLEFHLDSLINGIQYVSDNKLVSNEFECPDILTEIRNYSIIHN